MSEISKLRWHCRRGMKELEVLLTRYLEQSYPDADLEEKALFVKLLELQDPLMYTYMIGRDTSPDESLQTLIDKIRRLSQLID